MVVFHNKLKVLILQFYTLEKVLVYKLLKFVVKQTPGNLIDCWLFYTVIFTSVQQKELSLLSISKTKNR